jgi:3-hydroxyisobutyrate dehydrogenase-like beta-hydroxyacid dehydrogenase
VRTVGVVSPGAMGSAVADALVRGGARVVATLDGRSERTAGLADRARGLELAPDLASVVRAADVVLSIVPPGEARAVAAAVARAAEDQNVAPLFADLNAIAPATVRSLERSGLDLVDGSISGPPPWTPGTTRVYLSGSRAHELAALPFEGVELLVVGDEVGAASAVKMSTASVYKGTSAVLAQALLAAYANGVLDHVLADLAAGAPETVARAERRVAVAATKAERYVDEMREISATQQAAGLPALFDAMAEVYERLARTPLAQRAPEDVATELALTDVLDELR